MLVHDTGNAWQCVLMTDHAEQCAQFAMQWGGSGFERPDPLETVVTASARHDDGWTVWDVAPTLERDGTPASTRRLPVSLGIALDRACIAAVTVRDPYAGLIVAMHRTALRVEGCYGWSSTPLGVPAADADAIDAFVREQETDYGRRIGELGLDRDEVWRNYDLLQIYDRLSLFFCGLDRFRHIEKRATEGNSAVYGFDVVPDDPALPVAVRMSPFPFLESPARFTLKRRVLAKKAWPDEASFRRELFATPAEELAIAIRA